MCADFKFASFIIGKILSCKRKLGKWSEISLLKIAILKLEFKKAVCGDTAQKMKFSINGKLHFLCSVMWPIAQVVFH